MPQRPPQPCRTCHRLGPWHTTRGHCPNCTAHNEKARRAARGNRYGHHYRVARAKLLANNPPCHWCGAPATTADHLTPASQGGEVDGNLVPACAHCNYSRGARPTP